MNEQEVDRLLLRYLDDALSEEEALLLSDVLQHDAEARRRLRDISEQAIAISDVARRRESQSLVLAGHDAPSTGKTSRRRRPMAWCLAAVLAALVGGGLLLALQNSSPEPVLEVLAVHGAATWSDGGRWLPLTAGNRLAAGTIETGGETATVDIGFADGTRFTLNGASEVVFGEDLSRWVMLKRGTFTASVAKQSTNRPLRVRTTVAEVEVIGTVFTLDALPRTTNLSVAEGRVRLKRLVDGREVDVVAKQQVAASLVAADGLVPQTMRSPDSEWELDFSTPPEQLTGVWHDAAADEIPFIEAAPIAVRLATNNRSYVHHGVIVRAPSNSVADAFAMLREDSVLRLKLRVARSAPLQLMLATRGPDGGFTGNFELVKRRPDVVGDGHWHTLEIPLRDLKPLHDDRAQVAAGNLANVVIITTLHHSVDLNVAGISIGAADRDTRSPAPSS